MKNRLLLFLIVALSVTEAGAAPAQVPARAGSMNSKVNGAKAAQIVSALQARSSSLSVPKAAKGEAEKPKPDSAQPAVSASAKPAPSGSHKTASSQVVSAKTTNHGDHAAAHKNHAQPQAMLVPPPPPDTPTILPDALGGGFMPVEFMTTELAAQRRKDLVLQLQSEKALLKDKEDMVTEKKSRAQQFDGLYAEGVISRKELEASKREADQIVVDVEREKTKVAQLEQMLTSLDERLKAKAKLQARVKGGKGKARASSSKIQRSAAGHKKTVTANGKAGQKGSKQQEKPQSADASGAAAARPNAGDEKQAEKRAAVPAKAAAVPGKRAAVPAKAVVVPEKPAAVPAKAPAAQSSLSDGKTPSR